VKQNSSGGRYLIRGCFAATLGVLWLFAAKQVVPLSPQMFVAVFSIAMGAEMVGIGLLRERARRSLN
jgi:hypothetical protein